MIKNSPKTTLLFTDFDGTLYDLSYQILLSPIYNYQTAGIIRQKKMTFIIVTGRPNWSWVDSLLLRLLRLPTPDIVIYGAGSNILRRKKNGYSIDSVWQEHIAETKITWADVMAKPHRWQKNLVEESFQSILDHWQLRFMNITNPFMSVVSITNFQIRQVKKIMQQMQMEYKSGIKMILTEKLYLPNSLDVFNGYLLIIPERSGKDSASKYVLSGYEKANPDALFFGDALIDVPMLVMDTRAYTNRSYSYGIHMTPLALENMKITDPRSNIVHFKGSAPKAFRDIIKAYASGTPISAQQHVKIVEPA